MGTKYFLYARKSTDEEERQILSISAQLAELKEFAAKEKLEIVASLCEAKTAKEPGRTVFGEMLNRIEKGEAQGILSWHPDRLARNSIDGGRIIYMVDTGKINSLKFPTFWFESTPQGKFMLNIAFGQSKYYIDNLSENVRRGLRQKLRNGDWPGKAPFGYLNDLRTRKIVIDSQKYKLVKEIFEFYATGEHPLEEVISKFDLRSPSGKAYSASILQRKLQNSFYCGVFKYKGEMHQGSHEPIITKKLFDEVQAVMVQRGKKRKKIGHNFTFTGLMSCGTCGRSITAETKKGHIYYRCTKKQTICDEKYVREENLVSQFKNILQEVSLADDWADKMLAKLEEEKQSSNQSSLALVHALESQIEAIMQKMDKLLDSHLEGVIDKADYVCKKEKFLNEKLALEEEITEIKNKGNNWLEPMREFILSSKLAKKVAQQGDFSQIRTFLKNIGSNFILKGKKCEFLAKIGWRLVPEIARIRDWYRQGESDPCYQDENLVS